MRLLRDRNGLETTEYAVLAVVLVIASVIALVILRDAIGDALRRVAAILRGS